MRCFWPRIIFQSRLICRYRLENSRKIPYIKAMKTALAPLAFCLFLLPAQAQDSQVDKGFDLMQQGAELLLRRLFAQMEPAMKDMQGALEEMQPHLKQLMEMVGDFRNYGAPVLQPNGDILIPRKVPLPTVPQATPQSGPEIEL